METPGLERLFFLYTKAQPIKEGLFVYDVPDTLRLEVLPITADHRYFVAARIELARMQSTFLTKCPAHRQGKLSQLYGIIEKTYT